MPDVSPWATTGPVSSSGGPAGTITLVEGQTFCLSDTSGDFSPELARGLFVLDTRFLSRWELRVNGSPVEGLSVSTPEPFGATFVGRAPPAPGKADAELCVFRHRHIGQGLREGIVITNYGLHEAGVQVELICDADFADLFEVKEGRVPLRSRVTEQPDRCQMRFRHHDPPMTKQVTISFSVPALVEPGIAVWRLSLAPRQRWELCIEATVTLNGAPVTPRFRCGAPDTETVPSRRLASWRAAIPSVDSDSHALVNAVQRSGEDLGALRIFDPEFPDRPILAAGAPWFMTIFGRDSLLTAWMTLGADHTLARGVLETLARFQGERLDPNTEEEPGKILHEMRFGAAAGLALGGGDVYYGSIDATPLFVMLLGELRRWDPTDQLVERLLPHADRALAWIEEYGDRDGDGYIEYQRRTPTGLANQGWKDSWDGIRFASGEIPQTPIALCEVQGYVYAAYVARAHFAREAGDQDTFERYRTKASELRRRFNRDFWLEEEGFYALGLDADKRCIDGIASNAGHCLWTGIVDPDKARPVADRLLSPELFSGWGIRTLADTMAAFNPLSYHNGSVWPHDNAIIAAGLARYGFTSHALRVINGQLAAATATGGRLPELFAGFGRDTLDTPTPYPTSCSPQAWAAAAPLLWLRTMLRLDPWAPHGQLWIHPELPEGISRLRVEGIAIGGRRVTITVESGDTTVGGAGDIEVIALPRPPLTATFDPQTAAGADTTLTGDGQTMG